MQPLSGADVNNAGEHEDLQGSRTSCQNPRRPPQGITGVVGPLGIVTYILKLGGPNSCVHKRSRGAGKSKWLRRPLTEFDSKVQAGKEKGTITCPPAISLPKGGGAIHAAFGEKFSVNPATGIVSLTVPIFSSPTRSDYFPRLSLSYDSGAGNGPFVARSLAIEAPVCATGSCLKSKSLKTLPILFES
jgi:hypothetical protein